MSILVWDIPETLLNSPEVTNRNSLAKKWHTQNSDDILKQYIKMNAQQARDFYIQIFRCFPDLALRGTGIELGAGVAALSTICVDYFPDIEKIYAVELVPDVVRLLQSKTATHISKERGHCVLPVIGSFDNLGLPDNSVDFCVEFASLHHSHDLRRTLIELARVLRKGATLLAIDRAHNNALSDEQVNYMLDLQYSDEWKKTNGYSLEPLSRRDNGEHEYRLEKWESDFSSAGFRLLSRKELRKVGFSLTLKSISLCLPFTLRKLLKIFPSRARPQAGEVSWRLKNYFFPRAHDLYVPAIHEYSVFLLQKI
jgi:SAM-dependent methyltransferase